MRQKLQPISREEGRALWESGVPLSCFMDLHKTAPQDPSNASHLTFADDDEWEDVFDPDFDEKWQLHLKVE